LTQLTLAEVLTVPATADMSSKDPTKSSPELEDNSSSNTSSDEEEHVESLVVGREKRATAGNRLSAFVDKEKDDEIELLFAEDEQDEDQSFDEDEDDASDVALDSSSDEDDQGPAKGDDDLAGEKELQKQDRMEKKKRKAQDMLKSGAIRKKVKIDPPAIQTASTPAARPKKKSERVSWVHTPADAPTRISSRKQTVQNREIVHRRLLDSEQQRLKIMHQMEEAQKRKNASKPKALTQAQRMEEAAKMERKNAKSLNRWEESERKRAEEQKAKQEALHNRELSGPVIKWWSGMSRWVNGKIEQLGIKAIRDAGFKEPPKSLDSNGINEPGGDRNNTMAEASSPQNLQSSQSEPQSRQQATYSQSIQFTAPQGPYGFLDGIHAYANLPMQQQQAEFTGTADGDMGSNGHPPPAPPYYYRHGPPVPPAPPPPKAPEIEYSSRNIVALKNFDANASRIPEIQNGVLVKKRSVKPQSEWTSNAINVSLNADDA